MSSVFSSALPPPPSKSRSGQRRDPMLELLVDALLQQVHCPELLGRVSVWWSTRLRSTAGLASHAERRIILNAALPLISEAEVDRTLRHELAHLVAQSRSRRRIAPHGPEWKQVCAELGLPGEARCHQLPLRRRFLPRRLLYVCPSCGAEVRRVRPLRRQEACLACCRKKNGGRYHPAFRLQLRSQPEA